LPSINHLVNEVAGNSVLSFLDAYSGYNQIPMAPADMIKTAFITEDTNYFIRSYILALKTQERPITYDGQGLHIYALI